MLRPFASALVALFIVVGATTVQAATKIVPVTSPGGIKAWLVEEHSIPMLALELNFRGGASLDPDGKEGLSNLLSGLLDEGAGPLDSEAFQQRLQDLAISINFSASRDSFSGSLRTLTINRDAAFDLLGLALTQPRFDAEPVARIRDQVLNGIRSRSEDPNTIVGNTFFRLAFPGHPYGRPTNGTMESVAAVTTDDLKRFIATRFGRDNLVIGVVGDVTPEELGKLLDRAFAKLHEKAQIAQVAEVVPQAAGRLELVRKDIPQSVVMWGLPGIKRDDPDYFAAVLMNFVLGGSTFNSRLYSEIREKRGLAYSVYSSVVPFERSSLLIGGVGTANERVKESLDLMRAEIRNIADKGITDEELALAKTYTIGAFALSLDSNARIAQTLLSLQIYNLGLDYLDKRAGIINAITKADVQRIAQKLLRADAMTVVVVGDPRDVVPAAGKPPG